MEGERGGRAAGRVRVRVVARVRGSARRGRRRVGRCMLAFILSEMEENGWIGIERWEDCLWLVRLVWRPWRCIRDVSFNEELDIE